MHQWQPQPIDKSCTPEMHQSQPWPIDKLCTPWTWIIQHINECLEHHGTGFVFSTLQLDVTIYICISKPCVWQKEIEIKFEKIWMGEQKRQHAHEFKFKMVFLTNRHMCMMELISSTSGFQINNSELNNMHCCLDGAAVKDIENSPTKHLILSCTCSGVLWSTESCTSFLQVNVFCMHLLKPITLQPKHIGAS
jgi:hypothetical protein